MNVRVALIALALVACHHAVHRPGEEWLAAIEFEGNHEISSDDLRQGLALRRVQSQGGAPDPYVVASDGERIKGKYARRGFLEAIAHPAVARRGDATTVTFQIDEGPRSTTRVKITGLPIDPDVKPAKVRAQLHLEDGAPFDYAAYDDAKERLLGVIQDAGYAHARVDIHVEVVRAQHEAIIMIAYEPGPKCRFGHVEINGVGGALAEAARQRVAFEAGATFSNAAIAATQRAIYGMRRFSTVRVLPDKSSGDVINVRIALAESARHELSAGGGFGIDPANYEVRGRVGYAILGWPFPLDTVELDLRPAYAVLRDGSGAEPRVRALATLSRTDFIVPFLTGQISAGYNYLTVEAYTMFGPIARVGVESPIVVDQLRLRVGWELQHLDFTNISPLVGPLVANDLGLDQTEVLGKYEQTLTFDVRDSPIEPHHGIYAQVKVSEGGPYAAGNQTFQQITPEVRGYAPVGEVVVAARLRAGVFFGDVPVSERYYSGGATTQRGFSERRLAPTLINTNGATGNVPIGGAGLFESNIELRSRLTTVRGMGLGGAVFLDGANVTNEVKELDLRDLNWAAGGGVRLFTIVGAVRLDFGYRLNKTGPLEPEPNSHYAFHLSIGEAY